MTLDEKLKSIKNKASTDATSSLDKLAGIKNKQGVPAAPSASQVRDIFTPGNNYASLSKPSTASRPVTSSRDTLLSSPLSRDVVQSAPEPYKSEFGYGTDGFYGSMASKVANSFVADIPGQVVRATGQVIGAAYGLGESVFKRKESSSPKSLDDIKKNIIDTYENGKKRSIQFGQVGEQIGRALPALPLATAQGLTEIGNTLYEGLKGNPSEALNYIAQKTKQAVPNLSDEQAFNYAITGNLEGDVKKINNEDMARVWFGALIQAGVDVWQIASLGSAAINQYYAANQLKGWKPITSAQFKDGLIKVVDESGSKTSFNPKLIGRQGEITIGKPTFTRRLGEPVTNLLKDSRRGFITNEPIQGQLGNQPVTPRPVDGQLRLNSGQAQLETQSSPALLTRGVSAPESSPMMISSPAAISALGQPRTQLSLPSAQSPRLTATEPSNARTSATINLPGKVYVEPDVAESLRSAKGMSVQDIVKKHPDIQLKRDVPATDIYGNKVTIPDGEALTPYELKGNKVLLQDGETYIVSKNQYQNIKGQSKVGEAKEFAPELKGTEETVKGGERKTRDLETLAREKYGKSLDELSVEQRINVSSQQSKNFELTTKFSQYQLPDGKNYKEVLIKAPAKKWVGDAEFVSYNQSMKDKYGISMWEKMTPEEAKTLDSLSKKNTPAEEAFKSSHWDEPNVISHLRLNERTYKGKKVTFMEELQSDWAKEGRSKGFANDKNSAKARLAEKDLFFEEDMSGDANLVNKEGDFVEYDTLSAENKALVDAYAGNAETFAETQGVPNNPLLKKWTELGVKRALIEAVNNGSDYFAWINGDQTSNRYGLSTKIDNVSWSNLAGKKHIKIRANKNTDIFFDINEKGEVQRAVSQGVPGDWYGKTIDEVLGKGLADKIMEKETGNLSGDGLKFGGEWANNLYDKQIKNIVEDLTGAKVEKIKITLKEEFPNIHYEGPTYSLDKLKEALKISQGYKDIFTSPFTGEKNQFSFSRVSVSGTLKGIIKEIENGASFKDAVSNVGNQEIAEYLGGKQVVDPLKDVLSEQQAIKLTNEVKSIIKSEAPSIKKTSGVIRATAIKPVTRQITKVENKPSVATAVEPRPTKTTATQQDLDKITSQIKDKKWLEEVLPKQKTLQSKIAVAQAKLTIQGVKDKQSTDVDKERIKKEERAVRNSDERMTDEEAAAARERILKGKNSGIILSTRFAFLPSEIANYLDKQWQTLMGNKAWKGYENFKDKLSEIKVPFNSGARYPFEYILGRKIKDLRPYERGRKKGYANAKREAMELAKFVGQFSDEEQAKMIDIIKNRAYDSSALGVAAMRVEDTFVDIGIQLVKRGLLSEETFRSELGSYFPRLYEEFEKGDRFIQQMWRKKIHKDFAKLKKDAYGVIYGKGGNKQVKKFQTEEERDTFATGLRAEGKRYTTFAPLSEEVRAEKKEIKTMTLPVLKRVLQERISIENYDYFNSMAENKAIARDKQDLENGFVDQIPEDRALYGDLAGMYVHRWYYSNVKDVIEIPNKANQFLSAVNMIIKGSKTILDPAVAITNAISNVGLADLAGVPLERVDYWTRNLKESLGLDFNKLIKGDFSKSEPKGAYKVLLEEGILTDTSAGEDLQKILKISGDSEDVRKALLGSIFDSGLGVIEIFSELAKRGWIKAGDLYSFSENVAKSTVYDWGVNELGMSKEEAIQFAQDTIFDYSEVSNLVKLARKSVGGIPFPTFAAKMTEKLIETQIRKPFTVAKWFAMLALASAASMKAYNLVEDDMKKLRPDVSGNFFMVTGVGYDKNGKLVEIRTRDLSRYFPFGGLTKMPIGIDSPSDLMAVPEFDLTKSQNILSAYTPGGMIFKPIGEAIVNKSKFTEKEIYNKDDDNIDIVLKITEHLGKSFLPSWTPGVGTLWDKYYNAVTDKIDSSGAEAKMDEALLRTIGTKTTVINPETQYYFLNKAQQDIIDNEITKIRKLVISLNNAKKNPQTSDEAKDKLKEDIKEQEEKAKDKIQKAKEEMIKINKERSEFMKRTKKPQ